MGQHRNTRTGDVITVPAALDPYYESDQAPHFQPVKSVTPDGELKGAELDTALDAAGLSKSGTADEKRARLAEHLTAAGLGHTD